jgi:hypothetical protein
MLIIVQDKSEKTVLTGIEDGFSGKGNKKGHPPGWPDTLTG